MIPLVLVGYAFLVCLLTWPLPARFTTHLPGSPSGDTGVYVWNLWIFGHELTQHARFPVSTDHVFADSGGTNFSHHNYTPLAGLIALPLMGWLGVVGTFNAVLLLAILTSALGVFALGRRLGLDVASSWIAGALFVAAPAYAARETAHLSLVAAAPLPLFAAALLHTLDTGRWRYAVATGALMAAAAYCDPYYAVYAVLIGLFVVVWRFSRITYLGPVTSRTLPKCLDGSLVALALFFLWRVSTGQQEILLYWFRLSAHTLYNPLLAFVILGMVRLWLRARPVWQFDDPDGVFPKVLRLGALSATVCLIALAPLLAGRAFDYLRGESAEVPILWRSSPRGVDLLAYLVPNPMHAWFGHLTQRWMLPPQPDAFPEYVAAFPLTGWLLLAAGLWLSVLRRMWVAFTVTFILLSLGPFIHIAGANVQIAAPWALLRFLPLIGLARSPARFTIIATMGLSILVACWFHAMFARRRRIVWLALVVLALELWPVPRPLYAVNVPEVYRLVSASNHAEARVLELPTGIRDGTSSLGNFSAATQFFQAWHHRPVVGGYLSRVSGRRKRDVRRIPVLRLLFHLSEKSEPPPAEWIAEARAARERFLSRTCVRYVIVDKSRASSVLVNTATDVLRLDLVHEDDGYQLLVPRNPPACKVRRRPPSQVLAALLGRPRLQTP